MKNEDFIYKQREMSVSALQELYQTFLETSGDEIEEAMKLIEERIKNFKDTIKEPKK